MNHHLTQMLGLVLGLGVASQWVAWRVRVPAIVMLLTTGFLAGPVMGLVRPSQDFGALLHPLVKLSVAVILFEGGLNLRLHELKHAAVGVRRLVLLGVPIGFLLGASATHLIGGLSLPVSFVFGAIIVVTGPTVIVPLLRHARIRKRPASYLKWEGIVNDPIGALLAVLVYACIAHSGPGVPWTQLVRSLSITASSSLVLGLGVGWAAGQAFRRGWVPEYLKSPLLLAFAVGVYLAAETLQWEAGLAAATVLGIALGNQRLASIDEIRRFKEYITVILVSAVFILLTADLDPAALRSLDLRSVLTLLVLLFVVRPATVFLSTIGAGMEIRERLLVAWIAPRGIVAAAVAASFAPGLAALGYEDARLLVPLMFALIAATVTLHGLTIRALSRKLGLASVNPHGLLLVGSHAFTLELARHLGELGVDVLLVDSSWHRLRQARMAGLEVRYGEVLSEASEESLELNHIGVLLAATGNDAYNALVCQRFGPELGRDRVFQLPLSEKTEDDPRGLHPSVRGNIALEEGFGLPELLRRHYLGWVVRKTRITDEFTASHLDDTSDGNSLKLLVVRANGDVRFHSPAKPVVPRVGDAVLTFGPPMTQEPARPAGVE